MSNDQNGSKEEGGEQPAANQATESSSQSAASIPPTPHRQIDKSCEEMEDLTTKPESDEDVKHEQQKLNNNSSSNSNNNNNSSSNNGENCTNTITTSNSKDSNTIIDGVVDVDKNSAADNSDRDIRNKNQNDSEGSDNASEEDKNNKDSSKTDDEKKEEEKRINVQDTVGKDEKTTTPTSSADTDVGSKDVEAMDTTNSEVVDDTKISSRRVLETSTATSSKDEVAGKVAVKSIAERLATNLEPSCSSTTTAQPAASSAAAATSAPSSSSEKEECHESVSFKVIFNRKKHDVVRPLNSTVISLKEHLAPIIDVSPAMMKVMIKGLAPDTKTLHELGVNKASKVLVVGSKFDDVMQVNTRQPAASTSKVGGLLTPKVRKEDALGSQPQHKKILDKGKPDDIQPGFRLKRESPPNFQPLSGMLNKFGGKVRLTFKLELDQLWIGTKQRTEKVNMSSIRSVVSEAIPDNEDYHIMGLQLGTTDASFYWLYWVPAQYVSYIKTTILGSLPQ